MRALEKLANPIKVITRNVRTPKIEILPCYSLSWLNFDQNFYFKTQQCRLCKVVHHCILFEIFVSFLSFSVLVLVGIACSPAQSSVGMYSVACRLIVQEIPKHQLTGSVGMSLVMEVVSTFIA